MVSACAAGPPLSAPASCHWPWVVLFGFTFFLSQTSGVVLMYGLSMCCWPSTLCPCLMSLALGGPVRFYFLFVSDIWCGFDVWSQHVLLALHSLPPASCHWPWVVLFGFTFFLSQTSGVVLWHGLSMCCFGLLCYLLPFVALWQLALCPLHALCPPLCALCVAMWGVTPAFPQLEPFPPLMS